MTSPPASPGFTKTDWQTDPLDGPPLAIGVVTLLRQFHSSHTHRFMALTGQYVRALVDGGLAEQAKGAPGDLPLDALLMLLFVEDMATYCQVLCVCLCVCVT